VLGLKLLNLNIIGFII